MIYVAAYDFIKYKNEDRYGSGSTAARPLVEYLASKLVACGEQVTILSTRVNAKGMGFYKARKGQLSQGIILKLPASLGSRSRLIKFMDRVHSKIWLFLQLVFSAKRNEKVIMYHTLSNIIPVYLAKKIKGFKLV